MAKFCGNCGAEVDENATVCASCGVEVKTVKKASEFTGGVLGWIGHIIVFMLVNSITLGIAFPWMICYMGRWIAKNTTIEGKSVEFVGSGAGLFGNWIVWLLLSIITFGIYSLWVPTKVIKWIVKNIQFK